MESPNFKTKLKYLFFIIIFFVSFQSLNSQNLEPQCDSSSIKCTAQINLREYLDYENNIDERTFYNSGTITGAKLGELKGTYFPKAQYSSVNNEYESWDDLLSDLLEHKIEGIISDIARANQTMMFLDGFSIMGRPTFLNATFGIKKDSDLHSELDGIQEQDYYDKESAIRRWFGFGFMNGYYIDKDFETEKDLNVAMQLTHPFYSFKNENNNNEPVGTDVELIYFIAKANKYKVNLLEVDSFEEQVEMLNSGTADIAAGNFIQRQEKDITDYVDFIFIRPTVLMYLIRYENEEQSAIWDKFYEKEEDLDGKLLGVIPSTSFVDLTKENFPNSPHLIALILSIHLKDYFWMILKGSWLMNL